ncbi:hypothetical protein EDD17DRAFT_1765046 [Pisolithus thermaeus]|nr:hypothetical protein EV401DRAFT_2084345 [Pisolithus croceorrhizus]KAI6154327.1 hypothetical protein EDD17DRAFT_1765046 [Pisolithus thermaeus]
MIPNVQVLQETISGLQKENIALKAEKSAMQNTYNTLVARLTVNQSDPSTSMDGPVNLTLRSVPITMTPLLNVPPVLQLNRVDYPRVRYWFEKDWKNFCMTAEGQECSATAFIEDKNGRELASEKVSTILQTMRSIWHELRAHGQIDAQTTWSSMSLQVKKAFHGELVQMCPELNFCEDSWKSDLLAKKHYSSFKQTWFTNRSDEKLNSTTKRKAKSEVAEDADSPTGLGNTKRTKRNVSTGPYDTSSDGDISIDWPSLESNESSLGSSSKVSAPSLSSSSPPLARSHQDPDARTQPDSSTRTPGKTICTSGLSSAAKESASIVAVSLIRNPLSSLHAMAAPVLRDSPEPTAHVLERRSGSPSNEHTGTVDQGPQVEVPSTSHTAPGPTDVSGKKKSWRPPSNKSGRTLCMHRYQKQVSGSLDEFNSYFEALSPEAKTRYKDEAKDLV